MRAKEFMTPLWRFSAAGERRVAGQVAATGITVTEDTTMFTCIYYMLKHPISQLPVLDRNKKVVGVLQGQDLFSSIILIALACVVILILWMLRGALILPDPATFTW